MPHPLPTAAQQREIVNEVLASSQASQSELPALGPPEIVHAWERLLAEWKESIEQWVNSFLKRQGTINPEYLSALFTSIGYCVVVLALALTLFFIFQYLRKHVTNGAGTMSHVGNEESCSDGASLQDLLSDSLHRGAFAAALRLRWKIFLVRTGQSPSLTPRESQEQLIALDPLAVVPTLEEPMFSGRGLSLEEYNARHQFLLAAEGSSHGD